MIGRVYRGSGTAGLVRYLYGPGREESPVAHADPHLVGSWLGNGEATLSVLEPVALRSRWADPADVDGARVVHDSQASRGGRRAERVLAGAEQLEAAGSVWEQTRGTGGLGDNGGTALLEQGGRGPGVGKVDARHLVRALEAPLRQAQRAAAAGLGPAPAGERVWHTTLRNHDDDRRLSDAEWAEVASDVMHRTGLAPRDAEGQPVEGGCPWIAVRHDDVSIHLVAVLAREDGAAVRLWRDYPKVRAACLAAEQRYGLMSTAPADRTAPTHTSRAEREKAARLARRHDSWTAPATSTTSSSRSSSRSSSAAGRAGRAEPARDQLRRQVRAAAAASSSTEQFLAALRGAGLLVRERESERTPGELTGYAVALPSSPSNAAGSTGDGQPVFYGGGKLAPDLTLPRLQARWDTPEAAAGSSVGPAAAAARRTAATAGGEQPGGRQVKTDRFGLTDTERLRIWKQAELAAGRAAAHITASIDGVEGGPADLASAADAAWAASDFLAAAGRVVEGPRGGPLTDAASSYDRAARELHGKTPPATAAGTGLRRAGRLLATAQVALPSETRQLLALLAQLAALSDAVTRLRETQQRAWQAQAARRAAEGLQQVLSQHSARLQTPAGPAPAVPTEATSSTSTRPSSMPEGLTSTPTAGAPDQEQAAAAARRARARAGFPTRLTLPGRPSPQPPAGPTRPGQPGSEPPDSSRGPRR